MAFVITISIIVFILLIASLIFIFHTRKALIKKISEKGKFPIGHYVGMGIGVGLSAGFVIGLFVGSKLQNFIMWILLCSGLGTGLGIIIGTLFEHRKAHNLRPLTQKEISLRKISMFVFICTLLLIIVGLAGVYFLR